MPLLRERESGLAQREIAALDHLWDDIRAVADLKIHQRGRTVLDFVERGQLGRVGSKVRELAVVPDGPNQERLFVFGCAEHELQLGGIFLLKAGDRVSNTSSFGV